MSLSSIQLDAFVEVARTRRFSRAATHLRITQSALSQRILNLEEELGAAVFVRDAGGVRLTEVGERLLAYCRMREGLEAELLEGLREGSAAALGGVVRIGAFSSVLRSVVVPALTELVARHPRVQLDCQSREMRELPGLLRQGEVDFAIVDRILEGSGLEHRVLGHEENVLVEPRKPRPGREGVYLDHDPDDTMTETFLKLSGEKPARLKRAFLDDIYGILDGVEAGWGRAVVPRHLATGRKDLKPVRGYKPIRMPVVLHFVAQPYYTRLHQAVVETLGARCPALLG